MPELVPPAVQFRASYLDAMADFIAEGRGAPGENSGLAHNIQRYGSVWHTDAGFGEFVSSLLEAGDTSVPAPEGWVHQTTYWWVDSLTYLGSIRLRHSLTPWLLEEGGHIGYDVAPAHRLRGHGTAMLRAVLPKARDLGLTSVLITCDGDNLGSRKIIESNGGVYEDERNGKLRYWVSLT